MDAMQTHPFNQNCFFPWQITSPMMLPLSDPRPPPPVTPCRVVFKSEIDGARGFGLGWAWQGAAVIPTIAPVQIRVGSKAPRTGVAQVHDAAGEGRLGRDVVRDGAEIDPLCVRG